MGNLRYKAECQESRGATSWSRREAITIRLWRIVWLFGARWTPKKFNRWRLFLLRLFGAKIAGRPFVDASASIYAPFNLTLFDKACLAPKVVVYSLGQVILREKAIVSQESYLCGGTHDFDKETCPLMVGDIDIGAECFIGARAFILPGVTIGSRALIGACSVVTKDVPANVVVGGNPASVIRERTKTEV